jgi:hypothetical protein
VTKEQTGDYCVINGVNKRVVKSYLNHNGVLVPTFGNFYPKITWKKYQSTGDDWDWGSEKLTFYYQINTDTFTILSGISQHKGIVEVTYSNHAIEKMDFVSWWGGTLVNLATYAANYTGSTYAKFTRNLEQWTGGDAIPSGDLIYYIDSYGSNYVTCIVPEYKAILSYVGDVTDENPNAYPKDGFHTDGYWYTRQDL